jgi:transposase-like protein
MNDETRAHLIAWRAEIEAGLAGAKAAADVARGRLAHATSAEAAEKARVTDLRDAVKQLPATRNVASSITVRLAEAVKTPAGAPSSRAATLALETAESNHADLIEAIAQIDIILAPPLAAVEAPPVGTTTKAFETIVMPFGARPAPAEAA